MTVSDTQFNQSDINVALVRRLLAAQFPQWADRPIRAAEPQGWDNRTFRLGMEMSVRLPSAAGYTPQIAKEQRWLPFLAPHLPLPIPVPLALGTPAEGFPWNWSIYRWLDGEAASVEQIDDLTAFAAALAEFLATLQRIDARGGPPPGLHSAFRGGPLSTYDVETRHTIIALEDAIDAQAATALWERALAAPWHGPAVWFHGDVAVGNLLVKDSTLSAVIDFGCAGVGDPACDMVIAWTLFEGESRTAFRAALPVDGPTWMRGRGWALWKALLILDQERTINPVKAAEARRVIDEVLADNADDA
ncbi:MAG: aminoglycoside phosphotransferase family protein [Herpetosiphonaceae bacterium]|nr:aminoglycoside phosphotransferase family protein [Herpetosiphonaceae bacterium]